VKGVESTIWRFSSPESVILNKEKHFIYIIPIRKLGGNPQLVSGGALEAGSMWATNEAEIKIKPELECLLMRKL
jgi:hypothetical protein